MTAWTEWDDIHNSPDQLKRQKSAKKAECTPISIDESEQYGTFSGSHGLYDATLSECTCGDFRHRHKPCKHMYRLASELGLFNLGEIKADCKNIKSPQPTKADRKKALEYVVSKIESYSEETQKALINVTYLINTKRPCVFEDIAVFKEPINDGFLNTQSAPAEMLSLNTQKHTLELLETNGYTFPPEVKTKRSRFQYCLENAEDICKIAYPNHAKLSLSGDLLTAKTKTYTYLLRKFTDDYYYDDYGNEYSLPHGANVDFSYDNKDVKINMAFPVDEVTALLNKYNVNRCSSHT